MTFPLLFVQLLTKCGGGENIIIQLLDEMNGNICLRDFYEIVKEFSGLIS